MGWLRAQNPWRRRRMSGSRGLRQPALLVLSAAALAFGCDFMQEGGTGPDAEHKETGIPPVPTLAGHPVSLAFTVQPVSTSAGSLFVPTVEVSVRDSSG